jgi:hypothetical protein
VRREARDRAAHLLGRLGAQHAIERRVVVDLPGARRCRRRARRVGRILALRPLLAREHARDAAEPRPDAPARRVELAGCEMKCMNVSWVTSAAARGEPQYMSANR